MAKNGIFSDKSDYDRRFISNHGLLAETIEHYRSIQDDAKVGFVGGTWDMIHLGHKAYLEVAHEGVDILVVGVDSDDFARSKKKTSDIDRPVVEFEERSRVLAYERAVDVITVIDSDEGFMSAIQAVRPDILVFSRSTFEKGRDDITPKNRKRYSEFVKEIRVLDPQAPPDKISTTARIRNLMIQGVDKSKGRIIEAVNSAFEEIKGEM